MSRRRDANHFWTRVQPGVVAKVEDGQVSAVMIYGDITSERLREVNVSRVNLAAGTVMHGVKYGDEPPSAEWAWKPPTSVGKVEDGRVVTREYSAKELRQYVADSAARRDGESADEFYSRFALTYQQVAFTVDDPVEVMADALGESTNTIYQYIHRARKRGFLPQTRRSAK